MKLPIQKRIAIDRIAKPSPPELKLSQKDKFADFLVNFAVAWFVASIIGPFFAPPELTLANLSRILAGVGFGSMLVLLSLDLVKEIKL